MANARDINLDIVGHDKTGRATRSAGRNLDQLKRKADQAGAGGERFTKSLSKVAAATATAAKSTAKMTAAVGLVAAAVPPVLAVLAKFTIASVEAGKAVIGALRGMGPAAAGLLPLAAGFVLVSKTIAAFGEEFLEAIKPMERAWQDQTVAAGKLATRGIRPLAAQFVKVNFPAIAKTMNTIGRETNFVAREMFSWANTTGGQRVIQQITRDTSGIVKQMSEHVVSVGQALGDLAGRASNPAFRNLGGALEAVSEKIVKIANSISAKDVNDAFERLQQLGRDTARVMRDLHETFSRLYAKLREGVAWYQQNKTAIDNVRTALATLAIVVGVATGGWMIALGGAIALVTIYWDRITAAIRRARDWMVKTYQESPPLQRALDNVKTGVEGARRGIDAFMKNAGPGFRNFLRGAKDLAIALIPYIGAVARAVGTLASVMLPAIGKMVGAWFSFGGAIYGAVARVLDSFRNLAGGIDRQRAAIVRIINTIIAVINSLPLVRIIRIAVQVPDVKSKIEGILGQIHRLPGFAAGSGFTTGIAPPPTFATDSGFTGGVGGAVTVKTGPTNVDARVFLDGRELAASTRTIVHSEQSRAAFRARYGRRVTAR